MSQCSKTRAPTEAIQHSKIAAQAETMIFQTSHAITVSRPDTTPHPAQSEIKTPLLHQTRHNKTQVLHHQVRDSDVDSQGIMPITALPMAKIGHEVEL